MSGDNVSVVLQISSDDINTILEYFTENAGIMLIKKENETKRLPGSCYCEGTKFITALFSSAVPERLHRVNISRPYGRRYSECHGRTVREY